MKQYKISIFLILLAMFTAFSCEHMNDFHYEYIKDGEIYYTTKMDSVETYAGNQRVLIEGILNQPFSVEMIKVFYNDRTDSFVVDYVNDAEIDTIDIIIDNLTEKSYAFEIYTADNDGNRSVKVSAFGTAYGELYRGNLLSRVIDSDSTRDNRIYINWLPAEEMERGAEIVYTNLSGEEITMSIAEDSSNIVLEDFAEGIRFRSFFVPELTALDTFASDWFEQELALYHSVGVFNHPLLGPEAFDMDKVLRGVGGTSYELEFANKGVSLGYRMKIKINEDNTLELSAVGESPEIILDGVNEYNPATETFTLNFKYEHLTGDRVITETLTKK